MKVARIVEVEWDDHTFAFGEYAHDAITNDITTARTTGYHVREDDEVIVVALSLANGKPHDVQVVDKRMVRRVRTVRAALR